MARIVDDKVYKAAQELGAGPLGAGFAAGVSHKKGNKYRLEEGYFDYPEKGADRTYTIANQSDDFDSLEDAMNAYMASDWLSPSARDQKLGKYKVIRQSNDGGDTWGEGGWFSNHSHSIEAENSMRNGNARTERVVIPDPTYANDDEEFAAMDEDMADNADYLYAGGTKEQIAKLLAERTKVKPENARKYIDRIWPSFVEYFREAYE